MYSAIPLWTYPLNGMLWAAIVCWIVAVIGFTLCECLRGFSRSRLLAECKRRGHEERFREILDHDEAALLVVLGSSFAFVLVAAACTIGGAPLLAGSVGDAVTIGGRVIGWGLFAIAILAILPRAVSTVASEWCVDRAWPLLSLLLIVGRPITATSQLTETVFLRLAGRDDSDNELDSISEEIDAVVDEGERDGSIEEGVSQMIQRVVELQNVDVRDVMTPRTEIVTLSVTTPFREARTRFIEVGHSRIPVIGESPDDLLGVVYAKDLLHAGEGGSEPQLTSLLREPLIVPESTPVDQLLERMRQRRMHIAIVLDEYGGVVGLVTLEDILEEIVGDISDEYDPEQVDDDVVEIDERTLEVDARTHVDDLNDQFDFSLPEDGDYETVGGFVFAEMGRVPEQGESLVSAGLEFTVLEADRRKITRLQIRRLDAVRVES